ARPWKRKYPGGKPCSFPPGAPEVGARTTPTLFSARRGSALQRKTPGGMGRSAGGGWCVGACRAGTSHRHGGAGGWAGQGLGGGGGGVLGARGRVGVGGRRGWNRRPGGKTAGEPLGRALWER